MTTIYRQRYPAGPIESPSARLYMYKSNLQEYKRNSSLSAPRGIWQEEKRDAMIIRWQPTARNRINIYRAVQATSVVRERRRHCRGRTLTDGFRGCSAHKDATIFSWPLATFHSIARRVCTRCNVRSRVRSIARSIDAFLSAVPARSLIKLARDVSIAPRRYTDLYCPPDCQRLSITATSFIDFT